ncbi:glutathione S-transferase [Pacificimonas sp. WHA3]|uniref:Glutathione S-transferase n=1 Tax=Pacificimonas pallii TaxID=2827236 RepID=A0ABS6SH40_9SPHN|nr:glutathione S-transferase [Pacificimonas pallii]MBV7257710.1 glutathione S-transferase [Pacificimonas pallii]
MITLYWSPQTRAARALWALEEVGADYDVKHIDIRAEGRTDPEEFHAASPLGKVPALVDGEAMVADSAAIAMYLGDRYAAGTLAPKLNDPARGEYLFWLFFTPSVIEPAMAEKIAKLEPNPVSHGWGSFDRMIAALETRLGENEWAAAGRFTMADLMLSGSIQFLTMFGLLDAPPVLRSYMDRCLARPAFAAAMARDKKETDAD